MREIISKDSIRKINIPQNVYHFFVATGLIGTLVTGIFNLIATNETNAKLKELENQKYQYALHQTRFDKLQEELEYFVRFEVLDFKFINRLDINSNNYFEEDVLETVYESMKEFNAHVDALTPYLSKEALDILVENGFFEHELEYEKIDISNTEDINEEIKEYLALVNEQVDYFKEEIVQVIKYDISNEYIPLKRD